MLANHIMPLAAQQQRRRTKATGVWADSQPARTLPRAGKVVRDLPEYRHVYCSSAHAQLAQSAHARDARICGVRRVGRAPLSAWRRLNEGSVCNRSHQANRG